MDCLRVVIQQKQIVAVRPLHTEVVDLRIVEIAVVVYDRHVIMCFFQFCVCLKRFRFRAVVLHDHELKVMIVGLIIN